MFLLKGVPWRIDVHSGRLQPLRSPVNANETFWMPPFEFMLSEDWEATTYPDAKYLENMRLNPLLGGVHAVNRCVVDSVAQLVYPQSTREHREKIFGLRLVDGPRFTESQQPPRKTDKESCQCQHHTKRQKKGPVIEDKDYTMLYNRLICETCANEKRTRRSPLVVMDVLHTIIKRLTARDATQAAAVMTALRVFPQSYIYAASVISIRKSTSTEIIQRIGLMACVAPYALPDAALKNITRGTAAAMYHDNALLARALVDFRKLAHVRRVALHVYFVDHVAPAVYSQGFFCDTSRIHVHRRGTSIFCTEAPRHPYHLVHYNKETHVYCSASMLRVLCLLLSGSVQVRIEVITPQDIEDAVAATEVPYAAHPVVKNAESITWDWLLHYLKLRAMHIKKAECITLVGSYVLAARYQPPVHGKPFMLGATFVDLLSNSKALGIPVALHDLHNAFETADDLHAACNEEAQSIASQNMPKSSRDIMAFAELARSTQYKLPPCL